MPTFQCLCNNTSGLQGKLYGTCFESYFQFLVLKFYNVLHVPFNFKINIGQMIGTHNLLGACWGPLDIHPSTTNTSNTAIG